MYLIFALIAGLIGGAMSVMIRIELMYPGVQFFHQTHEYNVFVTSHGLIMIFFMVMPAMIGGWCVMRVRVRIVVRDGWHDRLRQSVCGTKGRIDLRNARAVRGQPLAHDRHAKRQAHGSQAKPCAETFA